MIIIINEVLFYSDAVMNYITGALRVACHVSWYEQTS